MKRKIKRRGNYYVYIVQCCDGTYYTGYTPALENRIKLHNAGRGARYTRDKLPVKLIWCKEYKYFKRAFKAELALKKLTHKQKKELIETYERTK